jgi:hypothetical protein
MHLHGWCRSIGRPVYTSGCCSALISPAFSEVISRMSALTAYNYNWTQKILPKFCSQRFARCSLGPPSCSLGPPSCRCSQMKGLRTQNHCNACALVSQWEQQYWKAGNICGFQPIKNLQKSEILRRSFLFIKFRVLIIYAVSVNSEVSSCPCLAYSLETIFRMNVVQLHHLAPVKWRSL